MKKTKIAWIIVMISVFALSSCGWFQEPVQGTVKVPGVMVPEAVPAIGSPVHPEKINWSVLQYNRLLPILLWAASIGQGVSSSLIFTPALSKPPR